MRYFQKFHSAPPPPAPDAPVRKGNAVFTSVLVAISLAVTLIALAVLVSLLASNEDGSRDSVVLFPTDTECSAC